MQEPASPVRVGVTEYTGAGGYFEVIAVALAVIGLAMAVGATVWLRPPLVYWPVLLGVLAVYAAAMLWLTRRWLPWIIRGAASANAVIPERALAGSAVLPCAFLIVAMMLFGLLMAQVDPKFLGFTSIQMLVFSALSWRHAQVITRWEQQNGSRLLMRSGLGVDRSDFLIQSNLGRP